MPVSWIVVVAFIGFGGLFWVAYNQLVTLDWRCERATADVDAQLKRRHALLLKLLDAMRAFSQQERQAVGQAVEIVASSATPRRNHDRRRRSHAPHDRGILL